MEDRIYINNGWKFTPEWTEGFGRGESVSGVETVRLPHTTREVPYDYFDENIYQMLCGYRKTVEFDPAWEGKRVFLVIEAAGHSAWVYVNGELAGEHHTGYTAFKVELTGLLHAGQNEISVKVDSRESQDIPPFGNVIDYMTYGGLYREVYLEVRGNIFIDDIFAMPALKTGRVRSKVHLSDSPSRRRTLRLSQTLYLDGKAVASAEKQVEKGEEAHDLETAMLLEAGAVKAWSIEEPVLYQLQTLLYDEESGGVLDRKTVRIGFREAVFKADGFYLNGKRTIIRGLNRHQSYPYVGYAMPECQQKRDADIMKKELGLNAVRTSHYPQSQGFIDRCDELGLLVFTEAPGWQFIGDDAWKRQAVENVREMVTQYRNHPSIILWGVRINESQDDDELYEKTNAAARELDPTRQTGGVRYLEKSSFLEDVYTYNDFSHNGKNAGVKAKDKVTPDMSRGYLISEYNGHMYPTKSFDSEGHRLSHALRHARVLNDIAASGNIAGGFGWCFADYNTHKDFGSGDRICYHGVLDMFRNPKPAAAVYESQEGEHPVLDVSSSMDIGEHPAGLCGEVYVFTNADYVRFSRNGKNVCDLTPKGSKFPELKHPPILVNDYVGDALKAEGFASRQERYVKDLLNYAAIYGSDHLPADLIRKAAVLVLEYHMKPSEMYPLYVKYVGNWGQKNAEYKFEAVKDGEVVKTIVKSPVTEQRLWADVDGLPAGGDSIVLTEGSTYDVAAVRIPGAGPERKPHAILYGSRTC